MVRTGSPIRPGRAQREFELHDARDVLCRAARGIERARGSLHHGSSDETVRAWKGLASTRWSLVDQFSSDGRRYVLARRNEAPVNGVQQLAEREHEALAWAALGHANKVIAYEMGISSSTVGVLLHRAARKLGTRTRAELIAKLTRSSAPLEMSHRTQNNEEI